MDRNPCWPLEARPYTTFLHADSSTFKELVQRFTGQTPATATATATNAGTAVQNWARQTPVPRVGNFFVSSKALSPSSLSDMPAGLCVVDKAADPPSPASASTLAEEVEMDDAEEEKVIKDGRFYLHPSPPSGRKGGAGEPKLLVLFPLTPSYNKGS